jgi:histidinol-phosphate aminotransferase
MGVQPGRDGAAMTEASVQIHGGLRVEELRAYGLRPDEVIDFSASVNPLGASPRAVAALTGIDYARYPDPDCTELREALAAAVGVTPDMVLPGNGATELLYLVVRLFVRQGQRPIAFTPTFGEFEHACEIVGATPFPWHANPARGFRWNFGNKAGVLRRVTPPLVYLCNPNNPTGVYVPESDVRSLTDGLIAGPLLLDESYVAFVPEAWDSMPLVRGGRVLLLRSMTKDFGLAGLRLGYLVAPPEVVRAVHRLQPEWSVSSAAQAAGIAALADTEHVAHARAIVAQSKPYLVEALQALGLPVQEGAANFVLAEVGDATAVRGALLRRGLAVRDCTSFGLPRHIRIAVRQRAECERLVAALEEVIGCGHQAAGRG